MKKIVHILTEKEKVIFNNFFLGKNNCYEKNKEFKKLTSSFIDKYELYRDKGNKDFSVELIWDKVTNKNHLVYFLILFKTVFRTCFSNLRLHIA